MKRLALCALLLAGCNGHAGGSSVAGALVMTPVALAASGVSRASGGCYAVCQQGEQCNEKTGLCEALRCRGLCPASQTCEETFFGIKCIDGTPLSVEGRAVPASAKKPAQADQPAPKTPAPDAAIAPKQ